MSEVQKLYEMLKKSQEPKGFYFSNNKETIFQQSFCRDNRVFSFYFEFFRIKIHKIVFFILDHPVYYAFEYCFHSPISRW